MKGTHFSNKLQIGWWFNWKRGQTKTWRSPFEAQLLCPDDGDEHVQTKMRNLSKILQYFKEKFEKREGFGKEGEDLLSLEMGMVRN